VAALPIRRISFQAVVGVLAVVLCSLLIWTTATTDVATGAQGPVGGDSLPMGPTAPPGGPDPGVDPRVAPQGPAATTVPATLQSHVQVPEQGKWVALTFDDGPWPTWTREILQVLKEHDVKATFCMVGQVVKENPSLVRAVVADGHALCNHTYTHDEGLPKRDEATMRDQMQRTLDAIHAASPGTPVPYYRAPGGAWSQQVQDVAASLGMRSLHWTSDTLDWQKPGVDKMLATVDKQLRPNGIVLMHDGGGDRAQTLAFLKKLIPHLLSQGYQFTLPGGA
jgi:peptidoglycan/xylan/chitin deacetylase (PgdA/CDA1 family)